MVAACMCSIPALARAEAWRVSESNGQVFVLHSGQSRAAIQGATVDTGDIVSTGKGGRAVLVRGEEYMVVSPNSRLKIAEPEKTGSLNQIFEEFGTVVFKIKKKLTPHFGVDTPYLAAVVKGTTFSVTVTEAGAAVQVIEGAVQVSTLDGGASHLVTPGAIGQVQKGNLFQLRVDEGSKSTVETSTAAPASDAGAKDAKSQSIVSEAPGIAISGSVAGEGNGLANNSANQSGSGKQSPSWSFSGETRSTAANANARSMETGFGGEGLGLNSANAANVAAIQNPTALLGAANGNSGNAGGGVNLGVGAGANTGNGNAGGNASGGVNLGVGAGTGTGGGNAGGGVSGGVNLGGLLP